MAGWWGGGTASAGSDGEQQRQQQEPQQTATTSTPMASSTGSTPVFDVSKEMHMGTGMGIGGNQQGRLYNPYEGIHGGLSPNNPMRTVYIPEVPE